MGLCPRPCWGDYSACPEPLAGMRPTYKAEGREEEKRKGED